MPVTQFDHSAVPTNDIGRMAAFYVRLGFDVPGSADWNDEPPPFCSIQFGENKVPQADLVSCDVGGAAVYAIVSL